MVPIDPQLNHSEKLKIERSLNWSFDCKLFFSIQITQWLGWTSCAAKELCRLFNNLPG